MPLEFTTTIRRNEEIKRRIENQFKSVPERDIAWETFFLIISWAEEISPEFGLLLRGKIIEEK